MDTIEKLENWHNTKKGRYVNRISIDTTYGATCWEVVLGNVNTKSEEDWYDDYDDSDNIVGARDRAEVYVTETTFIDGEMAPNCAAVVDGDHMESWPGLAATIEKAIELADKLGL